MIEPPSNLLLQRLTEWNLCTPADLRRCRRRVRRLARDLPAFDSVWIDALVQGRRLTPFQGELLQFRPDELVQGPCLLVDRLGRGPEGETYLARSRNSPERCVLKLVSPDLERIESDPERMASAIEHLRGFAHPSVVVPHAVLRSETRLVLVSRYVPGPHLGQLLVRRGRFHPDIVAAIARQLIHGLAALERRGAVHGDIRMWNVRLNERGAAVLVDAAVAPALRPELVIHAGYAPERYDGVAPETIGTGREADTASDLYALGCLLWQLLAGRSPFPTGDPLAKLASHQTKPVPDVREWAPDTPAGLAEAIRRLTAEEESSRPQSFRETTERLGSPTRRDRRRTAGFSTSFNTNLPRTPRSGGGFAASRWPLLLALLFVMTGAVLGLIDHGARAEFLQIAATVQQRFGIQSPEETDPKRETSDRANRDDVSSGLLPLPAPRADGTILLETDGPYAAAEISIVGALTIRGIPGRTPEIIVADRPLELWAESVSLQNIHLRRRAQGSTSAAHLSVMRALELDVRECSFRNETSSGTHVSAGRGPGTPTGAAIVWKGLDPRNATRTRVRVHDTIFHAGTAGFRLETMPGRLEFENCLGTGNETFIDVATFPAAGAEAKIELEGITLRNSSALLRIAGDRSATHGTFGIEARDCVFGLNLDDAALFRLAPEASTLDTVASIRMTGEGSLLSPGTPVLAGSFEKQDALTDGEPEIQLEGLVAAAFDFAGDEMTPAACRVVSWNAPRRSSKPPGAVIEKLFFPRR